MGVEAQNDLGGHESFAQKMTWKLPDKSIFFLSKLRWSQKKTKKRLHSADWDNYFCPNWGDLKKKKKVFTHIDTVFLFSPRNILVGKLAQMTWNCPKFWRKIAETIWNRPKFWRKIAQNIWNCPKFWDTLHQPGGGGGPLPPGPPTSYAYATGPKIGLIPARGSGGALWAPPVGVRGGAQGALAVFMFLEGKIQHLINIPAPNLLKLTTRKRDVHERKYVKWGMMTLTQYYTI